MVNGDRGHDRNIRVNQVDRIEPASQAHLEHRCIKLRLREKPQDRKRRELEVSQRRCTTRAVDGDELLDQRCVTDIGAIDARAFIKSQKMRRGIETDAIAGGAQNGIQRRACRALAIGTGDDNGRNIKANVEPLGDFTHAVQPEINRFGMQLLDASKPGQGCQTSYRCRQQGRRPCLTNASTGCFSSNASSIAFSSLISRRSTIMSIAPLVSRNSER